MGEVSELYSSESGVSGAGWFVMADGGGTKSSGHHDLESGRGVGRGKGAETARFLGAQSNSRDFLTDSDRRLFRRRGGEGNDLIAGIAEGVYEREELGVCSGGGALECEKLLGAYKVKNTTHKRRFRGGDGTKWGSDGDSRQERLLFRVDREELSSLPSELVEWVSEGVGDGLRGSRC